jgi:hypothetical protein
MNHIRSGHNLRCRVIPLLQSLHWLSYATNNGAAAADHDDKDDDNMCRKSRLGNWHPCFIFGMFQVRSATRTPAVPDWISRHSSFRFEFINSYLH